jgi:kynurenine formamidase
MVANTGTYLDAPFHRYADGADLSELKLASLADLPGIVIRRPWEKAVVVDAANFEGRDVQGKAVLIHTGWDRHWRSDGYFGEHPYLTADAADWLVEHGAALVGIDSCNIDNMHVRARPVHTRLLGAEIPICEHMTGLAGLPDEGFRFAAVPPKVKGMGTFPVRAYAVLG